MSTRPTLAALLRGRSRRDVAAFVGALYDARGATTVVDATGPVVDGDSYLVVDAGYRARLRTRLVAPATPPDVVVAVDPARADALAARYGVPVYTPTDLDGLARYGLDRERADRVFEAWFDRSVDEVAPASGPTESRTLTSSESEPGPRRGDDTLGRAGLPVPHVPQSAVLTVLVVAALVAFGVMASASVGPGVGSLAGVAPGSDVEAGNGGPGAAPGEVGVANDSRPTATGTERGTPTADALTLAPGLTTAGVVDPQALATAHARAMANRSYTWELTYVEHAEGKESGRATEVVRVERPTVYVSEVRTEGFLGSRGPVAVRPSYADGERRYRPTGTGVESTPIEQRGDTGLQEARASQYYAVLLDGEETSVVRTVLGDPRLYVVDVDGTSASTVRNYTATAHVSPDGTVLYYSGSYCYVPFGDDARETCLSLTMRYRDVGQTTVDPPAWYTEAESEMAQAATATAVPPTAPATPTDGTATGTAPTTAGPQTNETESRSRTPTVS